MKDIQKRIDELEEVLFYLEMADYIDWEKYNRYEKELNELKEAQK